jgi:hypothetical protein
MAPAVVTTVGPERLYVGGVLHRRGTKHEKQKPRRSGVSVVALGRRRGIDRA